MGPEYLVAGSALGGAALVLLSAFAGWYVRGKLADAVDALRADEVADLRAELEASRRQREGKRQAYAGLLNSARRRARNTADPADLAGLLLGKDRFYPADPAAGEARPSDGEGAGDGVPPSLPDAPGGDPA